MTLNLQRATRSTPKPPAMTAFWPDTKDRVAQGRITPFISNYMSAALFGIPRGQLAAQWAKDIGSPFGPADNREIAHVAQYYAVKHENNRLEAKQNYLNTLTDYLLGIASQDASVDQELVQELLAGFEQTGNFGKPFSEIARDLGYPRFERVEANPFRLLAEMPLPIYITTSHHQFLEYALAQTQNKEPVSEIFYWGDHLESIPSIFDEHPDWEPSVEQPLVYHLYGLDRYPESMALTEDDFLDLLDKLVELRYQVKLAETAVQGTSRKRHDLPAPVRMALSGTALLTLGYSVLPGSFACCSGGSSVPAVRAGATAMRRRASACKSSPVSWTRSKGTRTGSRSYLEEYFKGDYFRVFWGSVESCVHELYDLWRR